MQALSLYTDLLKGEAEGELQRKSLQRQHVAVKAGLALVCFQEKKFLESEKMCKEVSEGPVLSPFFSVTANQPPL